MQKRALNGQIIVILAYSLTVANCAKYLLVLQSLIDVILQMINVMRITKSEKIH